MRKFDIDRYCTFGRRRFLQGLGASMALTVGDTALRKVWAQPVFRHYPFNLGVASGEPTATGVVLWTRIAPEPFVGGGMPNQAVPVQWELANDEDMEDIVQQGETIAPPELGHAVHVEVEGLEPSRDYFYRFLIGSEDSPVGRTKTLPAPGAAVQNIRFGVCGCQRYEDGFYTAFQHMADENLDFIFHYGDYIYEYRHFSPADRTGMVRHMPEPYDEIYTLEDYRNRYAAYKADPLLQAAHQSAPFTVSWDDHEVDNNWAADIDQDGTPPELFLLRRAAAYQAYYENMPLRLASWPNPTNMMLYRRFPVGNLANVHVLDTRQYRSDQPCGDGRESRESCPESLEAGRTMLGDEQERWLTDGLGDSEATWNVLAQQVMIMQHDRSGDPEVDEYHMDKWDGAVDARNRLLGFI
ncbi:MAG: alkaline phosphatase D family protein, partial [Pseudomonadota bacterium]